MTEREVLKQALDALEAWETGCGTTEYLALVEKAVTAIKEALAQPEQSPVRREQTMLKIYEDALRSFKRETLKLALEALETHVPHVYKDRGYAPITAIKEALAQPEQDCNYCGGTGDVSGEYPGVACPECNGSGVRVQPEFIKHEVETAEDWSEWVCPNPQSYLMKCCDCGLVHEAQFRVAKYQPEPSEDFVVADDPDLQAQFRMRRNEQWSPKDTAYRPGGLAQPEQEPVCDKCHGLGYYDEGHECDDGTMAGGNYVDCDKCKQPLQHPVAYKTVSKITKAVHYWPTLPSYVNSNSWDISPLYTTPPQRTWVGLTDEEIMDTLLALNWDSRLSHMTAAKAIEAKLKEKNT